MRKSPRPQVMYHPEEGQRIEGCFVLFVKDFIFGFTCYPIAGMESGEVEIYVEENEISKRSEDPCVFYRRKGSEEKMRFYPMRSRIRVAWIRKDHQAHAIGGHCKLAPLRLGYGRV